MTLNISTQARNSAGNAIVNLLEVGSLNSNAFMEIRTGPKPSSPEVAATGTLLATLEFASPPFRNFSNGIAIANTIDPDTNINENGIAGYFRCYNKDGVPVFDGDISTIGGGGDIEFDYINFIKGGTVQITTLSATMPQ